MPKFLLTDFSHIARSNYLSATSVQQPTQSSTRYEIYQESYTSWDECKSSSIDIAFETGARTMCFESYTNSNGQKVYQIQLIYE